MPTCAACGQESPAGFRFCGACGAVLEHEPAPALESRRTVTVLFCDVTGSTALGERLDPESLRRVMGRYFDEMAAVLERHGGTVEKFIGDAIMAVFGIPALHEDDALRAVRAAAEMRDRLAVLNEGLERDYDVRIEQRTGINTGEVVVGHGVTGQRLATGDAVNVAARLEQAAPPGEILIGEPTRALVRSAAVVEEVPPVAAKGKSAPVTAWRLTAVTAGAPAFERRFESVLVGRRRELALLRQALDRATEERACHLFTVLGPAGIGKSRLVQELTDSVEDDAQVLSGRCLPYGDGITYWPLHEIFRAAEAEHELERALGATAREEAFRLVRLALERFAGERPLVVVLDDLHWAEPTFLDLVEHVADWSRDAPILLVCLARPELIDERPGWAGGKLNATSVLLEPLTDGESVELVEQLCGDAPLDERLERRIVDASEGNPLFVEEMLAVLAENGTARELEVPSTIQALIAARLDRLGGAERTVAARAAVEGRHFHRGAVLELVPSELRDDVTTHLLALVRKELIRPDAAELPDEDAFRFRHLLIRDAAYQSLPKEERAQLHERFAAWLEHAVGDRVRDYEEIVGYHLEQAYRYREELGPLDEAALELGHRASALLAAAADRALLRVDVQTARGLVQRAAALLPEGSPAWLELAPTLVFCLWDVADFTSARAVLERGLESAAAVGDPMALARLRLERARLVPSIDPSTPMGDVLAEVEEILPVLTELGDDRALASGWFEHSKLVFWLGSAERSRESLARMREHARRAGDRAREIESLAWLAATLFYGPTHAAEADVLQRGLIDEIGEHPWSAFALLGHGALLAMSGHSAEARVRRLDARAIDTTFGLVHGHSHFQIGGQIELYCDDLEAAEALLRAGCDHSMRHGETGYLSTTAALLGEALHRLGRDDEALEAADLGRRHAADDDIESQSRWRSVAAKVQARRGELGPAERLAREAVVLMEPTDMLDSRGETRLALAVVLQAAGRADEAAAEAEAALELFGRKGNVVTAEHARRLLATLGA